MSRTKTANTPELNTLLAPQHPMMLAIEQAVLRGPAWASVSAPVADQIAARLAGAITFGLVGPGQRLLEQDISQVLKVSRAPVREALRILEKNRLVEFQPRRGATVTAPDAKELIDIFVVRGALYDLMLREIMRETPEQLQLLLERHLPQLEKASQESGEAFAVHSFLLNQDMIELCGNRILVDLLKSVSLKTLRYIRLGRTTYPETVRHSMATWRAWLRAVKNRQTAEVLNLATERNLEVRELAVKALRERKESSTA